MTPIGDEPEPGEEPAESAVPRPVPASPSAPIASQGLASSGSAGVPVLSAPAHAPASGGAHRACGTGALIREAGAVETLEAALCLSRELTVDLDAAKMLQVFLDVVCHLFPGRAVCVRLLDQNGEVAQAVVGGELLAEEQRAPALVVKRSALGRLHLEKAVEAIPSVRVVDLYIQPFSGCAAGFSVPIGAAGELYGMVYVSYPIAIAAAQGARLTEADEPAVITLANQLGVALRNVRLVHETRFLRDSMARIIEHARALIVAVDRSGVVTVLNHAFASTLGLRRRDVLGQPLRAIAERCAGFEPLVGALVGALDGAEQETVNVALCPSGSQAVARAVFSVTGVGDRPRKDLAVAIGQDQTVLRHLERQVVQAEKLATLGQLAAGVVHEINNPLTSILAYADYLTKKAERAPGDPQDVARLRKIVESAERIQDFTRALVSYARPAPDQAELLAVNDVVRQALSFCEHIIERSGARLEARLAEVLPPVRGIKGQLQQVLINLVTNACHAVSGGGLIEVTTACRDEYVTVSVSDDGAGIRPEHLGSIFEPFFTTKSQGQGTGLGLSIVRNLVEAHAGRVVVDSAPGCGARFTVLLPPASLPAKVGTEETT